TLMDRIFAYDALDRLTSMADANRYLGYAYDTSNNRTLSQVNNLALSTKLVDGTNRLASVEQWGSVLTAAGVPLPTVYPQVHDNAGRLMDDGLNRYAYSDRGRLASVRNTAGVTNFLYNGLEQRVAKSGPLGTFFYAYDEAGHVLGEYDSTGAPLYEVIWLGDTPVGVLRTTFSAATSTYAATTDTVFVDHLNTPRTIFNTNGGSLWTWAPYEDPYAQIVPPSAATGYVFNLRMPGQIFDKETGLHHNGHRDYNPATGRYIQPDPIGLEGGINRYAYVGGNPISFADPTGLVVEVCSQPAFGGMPVDHHWLKTDTAEAGMGGTRGNVPGNQSGDMPGDPVQVTDHRGRSKEAGASCKKVDGVDENKVNAALKIGRPLGRWGPTNQCQSFVRQTLFDAGWKEPRPPYVSYPLTP
ncbi:MAG: RHS repeat-associated core domain-containing protein, partial [Leptothrix ochracea]|uniref:RHS repeat-associated core domain-containing protein n=1 Tax=Leptothrix ochracea TaxID=735331 RepID=UPI0034E2C94F